MATTWNEKKAGSVENLQLENKRLKVALDELHLKLKMQKKPYFIIKLLMNLRIIFYLK